MKINEIVQEGVLSTLGRGIAKGLGVQSDQEARSAELRNQAEQETRAQLPQLAFQQLAKILKNSGINLSNPNTYNYDTLADYLKQYSKYYFVSNVRDPAATYIINAIDASQVPANLDNKSILQYLNSVNDIRSRIIDQGTELTPTIKQEPAQSVSTEPIAQPVQQPTTADEPITIGGQRLDPNNPADAKIIAQLQKQQTAGQPGAPAQPQSQPMTPEQISARAEQKRIAQQRAIQQALDKKP